MGCPIKDIGINVFHVVFVFILLLYVGIMSVQEEPLGKKFGIAMIGLAAGVVGYHSYRICGKCQKKD